MNGTPLDQWLLDWTDWNLEHLKASSEGDAAMATLNTDQAQPIVVTLELAGLPIECPNCGAPAPDGQWALGSYRGLLNVICPGCYMSVAPVRAIAAKED
jgi:hypothetical protein